MDIALIHNDYDTFKELLSKNIDKINNIFHFENGLWISTLLYYACIRYKKKFIKFLLKQKNIDVNKKTITFRNSPLHALVDTKQLKYLKLLLSKTKTKLNQKNIFGHTPFIYSMNKKNICKLFFINWRVNFYKTYDNYVFSKLNYIINLNPNLDEYM